MKHYDYEEEFHARDRKQFRKERRLAQKTDRSKFKKTDREESGSAETFAQLPRGRVISIAKESALVESEGKMMMCSLKGFLKKETVLLKNLLAVGDWVRFSQEGVIVHVEPRTSTLARTDIRGKKEQLIAVNVDQVIIIVSVVSPPLKPALVDRYLIAAEKGNMHPVIVVNKVDLLEESAQEQERYKEFLSAYEPLGYPILSLSIHTHVGVAALKELLRNKTSVFSGQSGVGKSSLLNSCFGMQQKVGQLSIKTEKGSHTTTSAELLPLPGGGYCVDTPGIRSFGIWQLTQEDVKQHFRDISMYKAWCKYPDCLHIAEPECAVLRALEKGLIASIRYESYRSLLEEVRSAAQNNTWD